MAYVSKEKKAILVAAVKAVLPKGWKATFRVRHYSTIVCTIRSAPFNLSEVLDLTDWERENGHKDLNTYHHERYCKTPEFMKVVGDIIDALNTDNHNNSDVMTDYFDVGHYVYLHFGSHEKAFQDSRTIIKPTKAQAKKLTEGLF